MGSENVHHKNGIRDDNRIENLELWDTAQPPGQRVVDKIEFYQEFLERYLGPIDWPKLPDSLTSTPTLGKVEP